MTRAPWVATGFFLATVVASGSGPANQTAGTTQQQQSQSMPQASATKPSGPPFVMLRVTYVKPDSMSDFVALQKSDTIPGLQKAGVEWRDAWRSAVVGQPNTVAFITPLKSLSELDGDNPMLKAVGPDGFRAYLEKMNKLIVSTRMYIVKPRPDLGYRDESANGSSNMPKLGVLANVEVIPGKQPDFEAILKAEWAPGLKKANVPSYSVSEVIFGGAIGEYYTFTPIANFAALEKGHPIQQSLGEAGLNKLMAKMGPSIRHAERIIIRYDDELSFKMQPKPKTDSQ